MKKIVIILLMVFSLLSLTGCSDVNYDIVATNFIGYDASRAVTKDTDIKIKMLLKPGSDIHSYQPSAVDKRAILNAKVFIYVGGESDSEWVESDILGSVKNKDIKIINMFEVLEDKLLYEDEDNLEYDEHVWTNPLNYIEIVDAVKDALVNVDNSNSEKYINNANKYKESLATLDKDMENVVTRIGGSGTIVVADRNPFLYFSKRYNIEVIGALEGCSSDKNVPLQKIIELKNSVEEHRLRNVCVIELSDFNIAKSVIGEVQKDYNNKVYNGEVPQVLVLYSMQNISADDFRSGKTYISLFNINIKVIENSIG